MARRPGDVGEGGGGESSSAGSLEAQNFGKEVCPFIGLEGERGSRAMEGMGSDGDAL
jgi:hypothetical protein